MLEIVAATWVPELPSDAPRTPPGAGEASRGMGSMPDRADCNGFAVFYRKPPPKRAPEPRAPIGWLAGWLPYKVPYAACRKIPYPSAAARGLWGRSQQTYINRDIDSDGT